MYTVQDSVTQLKGRYTKGCWIRCKISRSVIHTVPMIKLNRVPNSRVSPLADKRLFDSLAETVGNRPSNCLCRILYSREEQKFTCERIASGDRVTYRCRQIGNIREEKVYRDRSRIFCCRIDYA